MNRSFSDNTELASRVVEFTLAGSTKDFRALYVYGSSAGDGADHWSDLDVCLITGDSEDALSYLRSWAGGVMENFGFKVDAIGLPVASLGDNATWDMAFVLQGLLNNSELLAGDDVRPLIVTPSRQKLLLSSVFVAMACLRRLFGIPFEEPLPESLPALDVTQIPQHPCGNIAWQVYTAVMQAARAFIMLEAGEFCGSKQEILDAAVRLWKGDIEDYCRQALELRRTFSRFGPLEPLPSTLLELADVLPVLCETLRQSMARCDVRDPSQAVVPPWYESDGTPTYRTE